MVLDGYNFSSSKIPRKMKMKKRGGESFVLLPGGVGDRGLDPVGLHGHQPTLQLVPTNSCQKM